MASAMDIEAQAAKWLVELDAGATPAEVECMTQWLAADPRHRAAYLRLSKAWNQTDALRKLRPLDYHAVNADLLRPASRRRAAFDLNWRRIGIAAAAVVTLGVFGTVTWQMWQRFTAPVYETSFGGTEVVALSDGSTVQLNGDSTIRIEFSSSGRTVVLERGEALFKVAQDVRRPFHVNAGSTRATAAVSHFSVRRKTAEVVDLVVADGQVVFERANTWAGFGGAKFTRALWTGDRASANDQGVAVRHIGLPAVYRIQAWQNGKVDFLGETLREAVSEINRYSRQPLIIEDSDVATRRVSGIFQAHDPRGFVYSLRKPLKVKAERAPDGRIRLVRADR